MGQATRRQYLNGILGDMGITVWHRRLSAEELAASAAAGAAAGAAQETRPAPRRVLLPEPEPAPEPAPVARNPAPAIPEPVPAHPQPLAEAGPVSEPWSALSLAQSGALLLIPGDASKRDLRLARDLLAAAAGDFGGKPALRRFDWPPDMRAGAVAADADAGRRAFAAFVAKDVADHGVRVLLCVQALAAELAPAALSGCRQLLLPDLPQFGRDEAAKRDLWRQLGGAGE